MMKRYLILLIPILFIFTGCGIVSLEINDTVLINESLEINETI